MKMNYVKWGLIVAIVGIFVTVVLHFISKPKEELDIFFDVEKNTSYFVVSNLGNKATTNVKIQYSLDCQKVKIGPEYISTDVPILTESSGIQPSYIHYFDNLTRRVINNSYQNKPKCDISSNMAFFIPFSRYVEGDIVILPDPDFIFPNVTTYNFTVWYCDNCKLTISAKSDTEAEEIVYEFLNPLEMSVKNAYCVDSATEFQCPFQLNIKNFDLHIEDEQDFFEPEYHEDGVYLYHFPKTTN